VDLKLFEPAYFISKCLYDKKTFTSLNPHDTYSAKDGPVLYVVGIKGTSSTVDWLTSLWIAKEELDIPVPSGSAKDKRDYGVHGGILHAARYLLQRVKSQLKEVFDQSNKRSKSQKPLQYIVFVGHSLGAAVASVASIILREEESMDNVFCFAYAPPPAVSLVLAQKSSSYVFSVVNNDDLIPRISMKQIKTFVVNIKRAVDEKNRLGGDWSKLEKKWEESEWSELEYEFASDWNEGRFDTYIPGRILFLYELGYAQVGSVEVDCDEDTLRIAILSSRMVSDHLLDNYRAALQPAVFVM
jgi:hypothetical protein